MLTPDADHLFDRGFISFEDDGAVRVSTRVDGSDLRRLGFEHLAWESVAEATAFWRSESFVPAQRGYLEYHRKQVFVA
jgi:predicted restriction endonuclease